MTARVLDVGNCGPDHDTICRLLRRHFDVNVTQAHGADDALSALRRQSFDLVLVNRLMDRDGSPGLDVICRIKEDPALNAVRVMLISNYDDYQQQAIAAGAEPGFGKLALRDPATLEKLRAVLEAVG